MKAVIDFIYQILILQEICMSYLKSAALDTSVLVEANTGQNGPSSWKCLLRIFLYSKTLICKLTESQNDQLL